MKKTPTSASRDLNKNGQIARCNSSDMRCIQIQMDGYCIRFGLHPSQIGDTCAIIIAVSYQW